MNLLSPMFSRLLLLFTLALSGCATPYGDQDAITGGVRHERLSESDYSVKVDLNGYSAPGLLKPMALRRARQIGRSIGYESFEVADVAISYSGPCSCYSAVVRISFSRSATFIDGERRYRVSEPDPYRVEMSPKDAKDFARLTSSSTWLDDYKVSLFVMPIFVDAVHASTATWVNEQTAMLAPRRQHVMALAHLGTGSYLATIDATLVPGESYVLTGTYSDGVYSVWIQHVPSKTVVARAQPIRIDPPLRQRSF